MQDKIYKIMEELVADYFKNIPYFKKHPELTGLAPLPDDIYGRGVAWALVLGNSPKTVISSGHYDVVGTDNYGPLKDFAYEIGDDLDFETIAENNIPFVLYGPVSKEYHQWTDRVERKSLLEEVPQVTRKLMDFLWS